MKNNILFVILLATLFSCKNEMANTKDPVIETTLAKSIAAYTCYAKASIVEKGSFDIIDHGFVYSTYNGGFGIESGTKISLNADPILTDTFSTSFSFGNGYYSSSQQFYVRAYLTNKKGTVYGASLSFSPLLLSVGSLQPSSGKAGDRITIKGENFSAKLAENVVKFNNTVAKVVEASTTSLVVEVPGSITSDYYYDSTVNVYVTVGGQTLSATFTLLPTLTGFSPNSGTFGTIITISGQNMSSYGLTIKCNDITASIYSMSSTSLSISVPYNITTEKFSIKFIKNGIETILPGLFTMNPVSITSVSPDKGLAGSTITINGTNFNPAYNANTVTIGGISTTVGYVNQNSFSVTLPASLTEGLQDIEVNNGISTAKKANAFAVIVPKVTSVTPSSGYYGTEVTVTGENLSGYMYVYFGDYYGQQLLPLNSSTMKLNIPANIPSGETKWKISTLNNVTFYEGTFTVLPPVIRSFTPSSGTPGSEVTIDGNGFVNYSTVNFGTISTTVLSISPTQIKVVVPSNAGVGAMKISVVSGGSTIISTTDFTITN